MYKFLIIFLLIYIVFEQSWPRNGEIFFENDGSGPMSNLYGKQHFTQLVKDDIFCTHVCNKHTKIQILLLIRYEQNHKLLDLF